MKKTAKYALLSVFVSFVTHFRWFTGFGVLTAGDWPNRFRDDMLHMLNLPEAWQPNGFGNFFLTSPFYFMEVVNAVQAKLGLTFGYIERFEYLWPIAVLTPLGAFFLARKLLKSDLAAFIASLAWSYNIYFFIKQESHIYIMLANALIPFALLAYIRALESKKIRDAVLASLTLFAVSAADFRLFYTLLFVMAAYVIFTFVLEKGWRHRRQMVQTALVAALPVVIVMLFNAYWLFGFAATGAISSNSILDRNIFGNYLVGTGDALTLFRGDWTDGVPVVFGTTPVIWHYWWLPLAALGGLWAARRDKNAVFFGGVALLGVFLGKQSAAPFTQVYAWLFAHFPGFKAFRESSKFFVLIALGYAMLVGYLAEWIATASHGRLHKLRYVLLAALIVFPLWSTIPLLDGDIGNTFVQQTQPAAYATFNDQLRADPAFGRLAWMPRGSSWALASPTHPTLGVIDLSGDKLHDVISAGTGDGGPSSITGFFADPNAATALDLLSIRYVAVTLPDDEGADGLFALYQLDRDTAVKALDAAPYLQKRADLGSGKLLVYVNAGARPHVYTTTIPETASAPAPFTPVDEQVIDMSRRSLTIRGITGPFYLHFTDSFHTGWTVVRSDLSRFGLMTGAGRNAPGVEHSQDLVHTNLFRIDPAVACGALACTHEADGTITMHALLWFRPQSDFDWGSAVAGFSMLVVIGYLLLTRRPREQKGEKI